MLRKTAPSTEHAFALVWDLCLPGAHPARRGGELSVAGVTVASVAVAPAEPDNVGAADVPDPHAKRARRSVASTREGRRRDTNGTSSMYRQQLDELAGSYERIRRSDLSRLAELVHMAWRGQGLYIGSGGALAVARLAADLHETQAHSLARAATPLELIGMPPLGEPAVMLFTASGRHPDAAAAIAAAERAHADPLIVVTQRPQADLPAAFARSGVEVVTLPALPRKEGFLATGSVLAMASAVTAASGWPLPDRLPHLLADRIRPLRRNTLVLSGPGLAAVAADLETRLSETGLSSVQLTDYRNFAHGRHTGYARHLDETTVVSLVSPDLSDLAAATLASLPADADVLRLESRLEWPLCVLDLLVASMKLVAVTAEQVDFDPFRPQVPPFGRRLYHLSSRRYLRPGRDPVDRKLAAARVPPQPTLRKMYERARNEWLSTSREVAFAGVVLDYDGTVCTTAGRFDLPELAIRERVLALVQAGAVVGFASGRGSSLHRDLRQWVPRDLWSRIELGLYNGGMTLTLAEELEPKRGKDAMIDEAAARLRTLPLANLLSLEQRELQLAVQARSPSLAAEALAQLAAEVLARPPALPLKVVASAHSVDIVPSDSVKTRTLERVQERTEGAVLAIGDQGQVGGNDFDLLAATPWSLSVDRVSGDPSRCWNLDHRGERGPSLLMRYLDALRPGRRGITLRWK